MAEGAGRLDAEYDGSSGALLPRGANADSSGVAEAEVRLDAEGEGSSGAADFGAGADAVDFGSSGVGAIRTEAGAEGATGAGPVLGAGEGT